MASAEKFKHGQNSLKGNENLKKLENTFLGQAHIASTGPRGATCRQCAFWYRTNGQGRFAPHKFKGRGDGSKVLHIEPAPCNKPILNKSERYVPHHASACSFFAEKDFPPPPTRADARYKID